MNSRYDSIDFKAANDSALLVFKSLLESWLPDGRCEGDEYVALNPTRNDHALGSFKINFKKGCWRDFATGDGGSDPISLYAYLNGVTQLEAARQVIGQIGTAGLRSQKSCGSEKSSNALRHVKQLWKESSHPFQTEVSDYLLKRGFEGVIPRFLRYHPRLKHNPSGKCFSAMIAGVTCWPCNDVIAIHRTYLEGGHKAHVEPNRMMLGKVTGGAVRLSEPGHTLIVAEGIETALSVYQATQTSTWAVMSASGLKNLILPDRYHTPNIIIAADHDEAGIQAAHYAADKWVKEGRGVRIALPPKNQDFNDVLRRNL